MIWRLMLGACFAGAWAIAAANASTVSAASGVPVVFVATLSGTIDPATSAYLESAIARAEASHAAALVVELDTPGGLISSVRRMAEAIGRSSVPVVVYTAPSGASAEAPARS